MQRGRKGGGMADTHLDTGADGTKALREVSPLAHANIRYFLAFRVFFNARFYYPVFTILFLDFGLTIEQFALLNTVWAFTIVLAEVPSGALADILGRKRLLVITATLMVVEMSLLAFVPLVNSTIVFSAFLVNRILSGLAEAMASGADEALAYDTLVEQGIAADWPKVLDLQMRLQNFAYIFAMTLGAAVYDPGMVNRLFELLGLSVRVTQEVTMRFPIYLTLFLGLLAVFVTVRMRDPQPVDRSEPSSDKAGTIWEMTRLTMQAGSWILRTPFALAIILFAMSFDHVLRMIVTLTSQYYRLISLPEASFGLIGSAVAVVGLFVPRLARMMVERLSAGINVLILWVLSMTSLLLLTLFTPYLGVLPMMVVFVGLMLTSFFTSHYLNALTDSRQRATVLSFKGLAFNAAYGVIGIVYATLIQRLRVEQAAAFPDLSKQELADQAFRGSITYFPWYLFAILMCVSLVCLPRMLRRRNG